MDMANLLLELTASDVENNSHGTASYQPTNGQDQPARSFSRNRGDGSLIKFSHAKERGGVDCRPEQRHVATV